MIGNTQRNESTSKYAKTENTTITKALSAIGSKILPILVTALYFLAYHPSTQSVRTAMVQMNPTNNLICRLPSIRKNGAVNAMTILNELNMFGTLNMIQI